MLELVLGGGCLVLAALIFAARHGESMIMNRNYRKWLETYEAVDNGIMAETDECPYGS